MAGGNNQRAEDRRYARLVRVWSAALGGLPALRYAQERFGTDGVAF